jgi:predicted CoA-binding protein
MFNSAFDSNESVSRRRTVAVPGMSARAERSANVVALSA